MDIKRSIIIGFLNKIFRDLFLSDLYTFIFAVTLSFYLLVWILNPGNYLLLIMFFMLLAILYLKTKDLRSSILLVYIISSIILIGKSYEYQLLASKKFDPGLFPGGYNVTITLSISHIFSVLMAVIMFRDLLIGKKSKLQFKFTDLFLIFFYLFSLFIDYFVSRRPDISFPLGLLSANGLIFYFYLRIYCADLKKYFLLILPLLSSFLIFESLISFQQLIGHSPVGKHIEAASSFQYWPKAVDEQDFTFRPFGTFLTANSLAINLSFWLIMTISYYLYKNSTIRITNADKKQLYDAPAIILGIITLMLTLSRASWLGFLIASLLIFYLFKNIIIYKVINKLNKRLLLFLLVVGLCISFYSVMPRLLLTARTLFSGGLFFRFEQLASAVGIFRLYPFTGVGSSMLVPVATDILPKSVFSRVGLDVHMWFFSILLNYGVFAFSAILFFIFKSAENIIRLIGRFPKKDLLYFMGAGSISVVLCFFVMSIFTAESDFGFLLLLFGLFNNKNSLNT